MSRLPEIREQVGLQGLNTLAVPAKARYFADITADELEAALDWARKNGQQTLVLGGGGNLVFAGDFDGLVLHMALQGRTWEQVREADAVLVLAAGENWHDAVLYAARSVTGVSKTWH